MTQAYAERDIQVAIEPTLTIDGFLTIPPKAEGIILFAHGSGSSRHSPRNQFVAKSLNDTGLATLLFDLLTSEEEMIDDRTSKLRFNIGLLAERVTGTIDWLTKQNDMRSLNIGLFGASTGAAAALVAASNRPSLVSAVVSRGGRPDMAENALLEVQAPTLLIVGGSDEPVIELNQQALAQIRTTKKLEIVPGATHLFQEPGKLEKVADLARHWFIKYLTGG